MQNEPNSPAMPGRTRPGGRGSWGSSLAPRPCGPLASLGESCKTKPICRRAQMVIRVGEKGSYDSSTQGGGREKQSQFLPREPPQRHRVGRGRKGLCSTAALGCGVQRTTPEGGSGSQTRSFRVWGPGATRLFGNPETPDGVTTNTSAGRGQLCETNPISGGAGWDGAPGAWDAGQSCKTNPISRLRTSDCGLRIEDRPAAGRPRGLPPRPR
jgi:hypothetical protein